MTGNVRRRMQPVGSLARRVGRRIGLIRPPVANGVVWPEPRRRTLEDRLKGRPGPAIRPMTRKEFASLRKRHDYYRGRAPYLSTAARLIAELVEREGLTSALELGPHLRPMVTGADVLELTERPVPEGARRLILHDATITPWPVEDAAYDLFVGLQVFEHLGGGQGAAFAEVRRIARHAVISLPIDWDCKDPNNCHHMISHERALSWFAPRVPDRIVEGNPGPNMRLIYVFEHLDRDRPVGATVPPNIERP